MSVMHEFTKGLWQDLPPFRLVLGLCPTLAVTSSANNGLGMGAAVIFVLVLSNMLISMVRGIIPTVSKLIKEGINISANRTYENPVVYSFTGLNEVKPAMIEEATKNARISAEKFATDSQSRLGKIKTANQGQISISNRNENSPHIKTLRVVTTINYYLKD